MIERRAGLIEFVCDCCGFVRETGSDDFAAAWAAAREDGWRATKIGKDWFHACQDCDY